MKPLITITAVGIISSIGTRPGKFGHLIKIIVEIKYILQKGGL